MQGGKESETSAETAFKYAHILQIQVSSDPHMLFPSLKSN